MDTGDGRAYFSLQVISARRAFRVSPPLTTGPPEFERIYRAQVNCSEYFPLFLATLWVAGIFFHEGLDVGEGRAHRSRGVPAAAGSPQPAPPPPPLPRRGGTVRSGLPVRAPPLLPGLRALCAAEVRSGPGKGGRRAGRGPPRPPAARGRDRAAGWRRVPFGAQWAGSRWRRAAGSGWVRRPAPPPLSPTRRLAPLYASARALWLLVALAALGLLAHFLPAVLRATLLGQLRKLLLRA
ncbi:leukotriene C4 synthase isoform X2 [Ovis canadensis]|uniref:leukotriene C4 synthase isoform X2 n=1 Tax=Ovis canadensis TaxID=37174 RepID=UPI00375242BB